MTFLRSVAFSKEDERAWEAEEHRCVRVVWVLLRLGFFVNTF